MSITKTTGTVLITGASSGIGAVYADRFARRGNDLILVARSEARLTVLAERLRAETGVTVDILVADLIDKAGLAKVEARLRDDEAITVLVNNAGAATGVGILDDNPDAYDRLIQLNVVAPTRLAAVAPRGLTARKGAIINISSVLALAPEVFNGAYSGTKAFILNFTQALAHELEPQGVRVQAVLPGATRTDIWESAGASADDLPPEMVMGVDELVDAALLGFDRGETVTIPPLEEIGEFDALTEIRLGLGPKLSRDHAASRYRLREAA